MCTEILDKDYEKKYQSKLKAWKISQGGILMYILHVDTEYLYIFLNIYTHIVCLRSLNAYCASLY